MDKVLEMNKPKVFPREAELAVKIHDLICSYDGEIAFVAVLGILELEKAVLISGNDHEPT